MPVMSLRFKMGAPTGRSEPTGVKKEHPPRRTRLTSDAAAGPFSMQSEGLAAASLYARRQIIHRIFRPAVEQR